MFISIKTKIIILITLIISVIAGAMMYFTHRDVGKAMLSAEEISARNVLELVELSIKAESSKLVQDKCQTILNIQRQLRRVTASYASILEQYRVFADRGLFSRQEAQRRSLEWLESANFEGGDVFVFGKDGNVYLPRILISEPDQTPAIEPLQRGKERVLFVDDEEALLKMENKC